MGLVRLGWCRGVLYLLFRIIIFVFLSPNLLDGLDFKKNERKYKYTKGKPAYSRHMLTRLVIMASVDGIFSSRKIMKLAEEK